MKAVVGSGDAIQKDAVKLEGGDAIPKDAVKLEGSDRNGTCSPKFGSGNHDGSKNHSVEVGDGGNGGSCRRNGSPKCSVEVGVDDGDESCALNLAIPNHIVEVGHGVGDGCLQRVFNLGGTGIQRAGDSRRVRRRCIGRGHLRLDGEGQLYVLNSEAEDSSMEDNQSWRPEVLR